MSGYFVVDMAKLTSAPLSGPPKRERRAFQNPAFSPPQELGDPRQRTALAVRWSGRGAPRKRQGQLRLLMLPVTCRKKRYRSSRLISLLASGFTAARVWSSTTTQMIATKLPFNYPRHLMLAAVTSPW